MSKEKDVESVTDAPVVGLSKREHIAAIALQGILAYSQQNYRQHSAIEENVQLALAYADALMKETTPSQIRKK